MDNIPPQTDFSGDVPEICALDVITHRDQALRKGITPDQMERQVEQEQRISQLGEDEMRAWLQEQMDMGQAEATPGGRELARIFLGEIVEVVRRFQAGEIGLLDDVTTTAIHQRQGRGSRQQPGAPFRHLIDDLNSFQVASAAFSEALAGAMRGNTLTATAHALKEALQGAAMVRKLEKAEPKLARDVRKQSLTKKDPIWQYRDRVLISLNNVGAPFEPWDPSLATRLGLYLVRLITDRTGLCTIEPEVWYGAGGKKRKRNTLRPHPKAIELFERKNNQRALNTARMRPLCAPPRDWESPTSGVFWSENVRHLNILGTDYRPARHRALSEAHEQGNLDTTLAALNAIQATGWRINRRIWETMQAMEFLGQDPVGDTMVWRQDGEAERRAIPIPADDAPESEQHAYRAALAKSHEADRVNLSKALAWGSIKEVAREMEGIGNFWFGWRLDFRGRAYPMQAVGPNPQGTETSKALLEFAEGKPIDTPEAKRWLAIHLANTWGEHVRVNGMVGRGPSEGAADKLPLDHRVAWVHQVTQKILACAEDPLTTTWWRQASDPWMFLAACFEWEAVTLADKEGTSPSPAHISHLPVHIDGTCNGLQHLSALALDIEGATSVNLLPTDQPRDIYADVAVRVRQRLRDLVQNSDHHEWRTGAGDILEWDARQSKATGAPGIDRKLTKRTVMTVPYGVTFFSSSAYVREALQEKEKKEGAPIPPWRTPCGQVDRDRMHNTRNVLEHQVWKAVEDKIGPAMQTMKWIQYAARQICQERGENLQWTAPTGWPVVQIYNKQETMRICMDMRGAPHKAGAGTTKKRMEQNYSLEKREISPKGHINGSAPNVVHSIDAAHMAFTVIRAVKEGVTAFAMVHDSFGTHAKDMETLHRVTREAFVHDVYSPTQPPILKRLQKEWAGLGGGMEDHDPPFENTYNPRLTLEADLFFS